MCPRRRHNARRTGGPITGPNRIQTKEMKRAES
jgi:hypothetical protein